MTSLRNRELGATLRHIVTTGEPGIVTIDHREYEVTATPTGAVEHPLVPGRYGMNDTTREIVGKAMYAALGEIHDEIGNEDSGNYTYEDFTTGNGLITNEDTYTLDHYGFAKMRDAPIGAYDVHLWERADDPAVVEAVVDEIRTLLDGHGEQADVEVEQAANGAITATLTALIGPRPQGE